MPTTPKKRKGGNEEEETPLKIKKMRVKKGMGSKEDVQDEDEEVGVKGEERVKKEVI